MSSSVQVNIQAPALLLAHVHVVKVSLGHDRPPLPSSPDLDGLWPQVVVDVGRKRLVPEVRHHPVRAERPFTDLKLGAALVTSHLVSNPSLCFVLAHVLGDRFLLLARPDAHIGPRPDLGMSASIHRATCPDAWETWATVMASYLPAASPRNSDHLRPVAHPNQPPE
jgi:hypothetical protein